MSAEHLWGLAQILDAARVQEAETQQELLRVLRATPGVNKHEQYCDIVAPDRSVWHISWSGDHVAVKRLDVLDVCEMSPYNRVRADDDLNF